MAGRIFRVGECLKYGGSAIPYPRLRIRLFNVLMEEYPEELSFVVDTGFEGPILVPEEVYRFFEVGEIPRKYWRVYRSLSGVIPMMTAKAVAQLSGKRVETYVESPLMGRGKFIVGREVLRHFPLLLNGPGQETCFVEVGRG